ncbi:MAG TPA: hydrogenase nickel incorporation protein HypB [Clostridia bacterium]|nr:hydrogenase nickel incorporation protein HypB [Clostridia bacterium]
MEIKVLKNIMHENEQQALENRAFFKENGITAVNVMASPGAGKTSLISKVIEQMKDELNISVIEGDIASSIDAEKIDRMGIPVVQINTGGGCHLDANMIKAAVDELEVKDNSLLFIENVGNLVCPSSFDLGESLKMVVSSVPEGHDKPYKYVPMFEVADVIILNKVDLIPYIDFDTSSFYNGIKNLNGKAHVFNISCRTGEGIAEFIDWLRDRMSSCTVSE